MNKIPKKFISRFVKGRPLRPQNTLKYQNKFKSTPKARRILKHDFLTLAVSDVLKLLSTDIKQPTVVILMVIVGVFLASHKDDFESTKVGLWLKKQKDPFFKNLYYLKDKIFGFLIFLPVIVTGGKYKVLVATLVVAWVFVSPKNYFFEYIIEAVLLHMYLKIRRVTTRFLVLLLGLVLWFTGWITLEVKSAVKTNTTDT